MNFLARTGWASAAPTPIGPATRSDRADFLPPLCRADAAAHRRPHRLSEAAATGRGSAERRAGAVRVRAGRGAGIGGGADRLWSGDEPVARHERRRPVGAAGCRQRGDAAARRVHRLDRGALFGDLSRWRGAAGWFHGLAVLYAGDGDAAGDRRVAGAVGRGLGGNKLWYPPAAAFLSRSGRGAAGSAQEIGVGAAGQSGVVERRRAARNHLSDERHRRYPRRRTWRPRRGDGACGGGAAGAGGTAQIGAIPAARLADRSDGSAHARLCLAARRGDQCGRLPADPPMLCCSRRVCWRCW